MGTGCCDADDDSQLGTLAPPCSISPWCCLFVCHLTRPTPAFCRRCPCQGWQLGRPPSLAAQKRQLPRRRAAAAMATQPGPAVRPLTRCSSTWGPGATGAAAARAAAAAPERAPASCSPASTPEWRPASLKFRCLPLELALAFALHNLLFSFDARLPQLHIALNYTSPAAFCIASGLFTLPAILHRTPPCNSC